MKVKFITAIYSNLYGTKFGGRQSRNGHYRYSLLSLLKITDADFLCYTNQEEFDDLENYFFVQNSIPREKLKFVVFDISNIKSTHLLEKYKDYEQSKNSDRCVEIQYSKFHWWWDEDKSYDYYYWIDAGLSHCGLIPNKYLTIKHGQQGYYESNLFQNDFLKNLIDFTGDKFFVISKDNFRNYWSGTVNIKWYTAYDTSLHIIGGLFGGHKDKWDEIVNLFENYLEKITEEDKIIYMEENIMTLMFFNHRDLFVDKTFDTWWCPDHNIIGINPETYFIENKSFYRILEELNNIKD
jgi:hypothetical protein